MKPAKVKNEGVVKDKVTKLLDAHKWFWFKPPANGYGRSGIADILAVRGGVFIAIETKQTAKQEPSPMQRGFLNSVRAEGCFGFTVHQDNLKALEHWLNAFNVAVAHSSEGKEVPPEVGAIMLNCIAELMRDGKPVTLAALDTEEMTKQ